MKITRRSLKRLIEGMMDDMGREFTGHGEEPGYGDVSKSPHLHRNRDLNDPGVHPARQIETGMFDASGISYWENKISKDIERYGIVTLDSFVDEIAGDDDLDQQYREVILVNVSSLIGKSNKLTIDRDNNIVMAGGVT